MEATISRYDASKCPPTVHANGAHVSAPGGRSCVMRFFTRLADPPRSETHVGGLTVSDASGSQTFEIGASVGMDLSEAVNFHNQLGTFLRAWQEKIAKAEAEAAEAAKAAEENAAESDAKKDRPAEARAPDDNVKPLPKKS